MKPPVALLSRLRTLASGRAATAAANAMAMGGGAIPPARMPLDPAPRRDEPAIDPGPPLATGLNLEAWLDYQEPDGATAERHVVIRNIHGTHADDGCPMPIMLRARCDETETVSLLAVDRIRGLRARIQGARLSRPEDIAMWLRVESGLLHQRDVERLNGLRRRAQEDAETLDQPGRDRHWVEPTPVRIETTRDDAPLMRRTDDLLLVSWDPGPDGTPAVIYVAQHGDARRGRAVRIAPGGAAHMKLLALQAMPARQPVADVPRWVAALPARRAMATQ